MVCFGCANQRAMNTIFSLSDGWIARIRQEPCEVGNLFAIADVFPSTVALSIYFTVFFPVTREAASRLSRSLDTAEAEGAAPPFHERRSSVDHSPSLAGATLARPCRSTDCGSEKKCQAKSKNDTNED